jgi:hypothetical protein
MTHLLQGKTLYLKISGRGLSSIQGSVEEGKREFKLLFGRIAFVKPNSHPTYRLKAHTRPQRYI